MRRLANRLKRARGQLGAVIGAVESGADCRHVITQLAAVRGALDRAGFELISTAMRDCASAPRGASAPAEGALTMEELRRLFLTLA
ncbi:copper-sensing transcriptional repressor CsoR [Sinomonas humi]|uniref:Copper-sensing transcriptional repressor CsoR n=1 Tax=Sinomonas humi TaxID=1338436 RepID=A0A0B2AJ33_9MICC|nr:copper-sensing transcriptional repressor CsoR [Sinomonas humi]